MKIVYLKLGISRLTSKGKPNVEKEFEKTACKRKLHTNNDGSLQSLTNWRGICRQTNQMNECMQTIEHFVN